MEIRWWDYWVSVWWQTMDDYICENGHKMTNWQTNPPEIGDAHEEPCPNCGSDLTRVK